MKEKTTNGMATASFVLALCGLVSLGLTSILGFILGLVSLSQIKEEEQKGQGMAITAIVIGGIVIFIYFLGIIGSL